MTAWVEFLLAIMSFESLTGIARRDRRSPTTPAYQLAKLFMVLDGIQDAVVLSGRVRADEMMYPVPAADRDPLLAGRRVGGYSRNNTCIAIACEEGEHGSAVFRVLGLGKPSAERAKAAYCPHLSRGLVLVHDRENSRNAVVRELGLVSETYDSREIERLPDEENPLWKVNRLCFLLRLFLDGHTGFDRANFPGCLDLFSVMMNPPEDRLEKVALVLDRAMAPRKRFDTGTSTDERQAQEGSRSMEHQLTARGDFARKSLYTAMAERVGVARARRTPTLGKPVRSPKPCPSRPARSSHPLRLEACPRIRRKGLRLRYI